MLRRYTSVPAVLRTNSAGIALLNAVIAFESGAMGRHDVVRFHCLDVGYGLLDDLRLGA